MHLAGRPPIGRLRDQLRAAEAALGLGDPACPLALGIPAIDAVLGGGLSRGALHEIAAARDAETAAATGFALGLAAGGGAAHSRQEYRQTTTWPEARSSLLRPLPSWERAVPTLQRARMGEGAWQAPPHPSECVDNLALPSPTRGEGAITTIVLPAILYCGRHRPPPARARSRSPRRSRRRGLPRSRAARRG